MPQTTCLQAPEGTPSVKRRGFLLSILALLGGVGGAGLWRLGSSREDEAIALVLRKRLGYLNLDPAGVAAFSRDLIDRGQFSLGKLRVLDAIAPAYQYWNLSDGDHGLSLQLRWGEERIVSVFLLSSDFFLNAADETRVVHYLRYYDPLDPSCRNPFARPIISPTSSA